MRTDPLPWPPAPKWWNPDWFAKPMLQTGERTALKALAALVRICVRLPEMLPALRAEAETAGFPGFMMQQ